MPESSLVINTGPIIALTAATGSLSILPLLYSRVIVPYEVCNEVFSKDSSLPGANELQSAVSLERRAHPIRIAPLLTQLLDRGEASVVQVALDEQIPLVCIDEHVGRRVARLNGLIVTGSLGILIRAKREGHPVCLSESIVRMREAGIFLSDRLCEAALRESAEVM